MSLILDALNRSRTEAEPVPGLASEPVFLPENESPMAARLPWIALVAALLLIAWLLFERMYEPSEANPPRQSAAGGQNETRSAATAETGVDEAISQSSPAPAPKPAVAAAVKAPPPVVPAVSVPPVAQAQNKRAVDRLYAAPREPVASAQTAKPSSRKLATAKPGPETASKLKPGSKPRPALNVDEVVQKVQEETRNAKLEAHPAPFIAALSQPKKDAIPTLIYERHDYNSSASGRSSVTINGKTLRKGGNAARGVTVDEILRDSVILKHQGTEFRLRALNSWVNL